MLIWKPERTVQEERPDWLLQGRVLRGHASRPQDATLGNGVWLSHSDPPLLLGLQEESPQAPKERYFSPVLSLFQGRTLFSAALGSPVRIGYAAKTVSTDTRGVAREVEW